jgi:murein DD-endopeptidase MepM/ murein hydrolase activator NlpD
MKTYVKRVLALAALASIGYVTLPAHAETSIQAAIRERREAAERITELRHILHHNSRRLVVTIRTAQRLLDQTGRGKVSDGASLVTTRNQARTRLRESRARLHGLRRWARGRIAALKERREQITSWLSTSVIFRVCPVPSYTTIANNFGIMVRLPGVPVHRHMGDDVSAPWGSPILAPFDGYASSGSSGLGGLEVRVHGDLGYVYNAHLSSLGTLGYVHAGDVIGYVGDTGDAVGSHDHLEWHPWNGGAVDPQAYLETACVPV